MSSNNLFNPSKSLCGTNFCRERTIPSWIVSECSSSYRKGGTGNFDVAGDGRDEGAGGYECFVEKTGCSCKAEGLGEFVGEAFVGFGECLGVGRLTLLMAL